MLFKIIFQPSLAPWQSFKFNNKHFLKNTAHFKLILNTACFHNTAGLSTPPAY